MKIAISFPPLKGQGFPMVRQARQFQWVSIPSHIYPIISASAATLLKKHGFEVIWNDCLIEDWSYNDFLDFVKKEKPNLIAIETKAPVIRQHWKIVDNIKQQTSNIKIVLMGDHVSAFPKESMENSLVDFIIVGGDYDVSLRNLVEYLENKKEMPKGMWYREDGEIKNTGKPDLSFDLNNLPFIDRDLTKFHKYGEKWKRYFPFAYTMAGRDCWYGKCSFCSWKNLYSNFRVRTPENLLDEIGFLIKKHSVKEVFDDTGTFPNDEWLIKFCEGMIERDYNKKILFSCNMRFDQLNPSVIKLMKKANFRKLKLGLESANQNTLDRLNKGITIEEIIDGSILASKAGLEVHLTVMVGYPWETKKEHLNTLRLAKYLMDKGYSHMLQATILIPYPGTPMYFESLKNNWFKINPQDYDKYDMSLAILNTPDMNSKDVVDMCNKTYKLFVSPKYAFSQIKNIKSFKDISYGLRGLKAIFGHIKDFS